MHLHATLTMADVDYLLFCYFVYVGKESGKVEICHMLETELPKLFVFVRIVFCMISGMFVSSVISKPDIVASICEDKGWSFVFIIDQPGVRTIQKSML